MNKKLTSVLAAVLLLSACSQKPDATQGGATTEQPASASNSGAPGAAAPSAVSEDLPPDQWSKEVWAVDAATGPGEPVLMQAGGQNGFRLVPKGDGGKVIYYQVEVVGDAPAEDWKDAILFPRGTEAVPAWPADKKLDKWSSDMTTAQQGEYNNKFKNGKKAYLEATSIQRLEGDLPVKQGNSDKVVAEALRLVIVPDANKNDSPLLIVDLTDKRPTVEPSQSGSGHGGTK